MVFEKWKCPYFRLDINLMATERGGMLLLAWGKHVGLCRRSKSQYYQAAVIFRRTNTNRESILPHFGVGTKGVGPSPFGSGAKPSMAIGNGRHSFIRKARLPLSAKSQ